MGEGVGAANSWERKHRYRSGQRACPACGVEGSIRRSKFDPGWYCHDKAGGCGVQFKADDPSIVSQEAGQVENPDPYDVENTLLKMAAKRAQVDAVLRTTATSGLFTQDVEDLSHEPVADSPRAGHASEPQPAVRADGVTTVKAITEKSGGGGDTGKRAWTVTRVTFADGRAGSTFDRNIAEFAAKAKLSNALVKPTLEQGEKGIDLTALVLAETLAQPAAAAGPVGSAPGTEATHADDGPPIPEKIKDLRKATGTGGKEWAIVEGTARQYVTDDAALITTLEQKKAADVFVVCTYDWVAGRAAGTWARKLKGLTDPALLTSELPA